MKLRHYTNSKEAAVSIIKSKQLWLGKTGEALKDRDEVNHFIKNFRVIHALIDIKKIVNINYSYKPQRSLYENLILALSHEYFLTRNYFMIGDFFSEVIRNESYIICFTEDNKSIFHESKYGPVSFLFSDNPLREEKYTNFRFLQREITYIDSNAYDRLEVELNHFYEIVLSPFLKVLNEEEYHQIYTSIPEIISGNFNKKARKEARKDLIYYVEQLTNNIALDINNFFFQKSFRSFMQRNP